jgi:hypothetical protein
MKPSGERGTVVRPRFVQQGHLGSEHRAEPMPPVSHRFMTDINATFMQHVFNISKGQRETNVQHNRQADYLSARFKITKWIRFGHP